MARRIRVDYDSNGYDIVEVPAPNEHALQEIVKAHPQLLPADDLGFDRDLAVVGRETSLASGAIDLLCLARSGDLVLVEFKTGPQNPDFRGALAQVIDYGSDLWGMSLEDFDRGVVQRYLASPHSMAAREVDNLGVLVDAAGWGLEGTERDALLTRLEDVLRTGDFTFVIAAQRFVPAMKASVDYLNATTRYGRYFLTEVIRLEGGHGVVAHLADIVAAPAGPTGGGRSPAAQINQAQFLETLPDADFRELLRDVFAAAESLGMSLAWGTKGTSIRMPTPDRAEPLSIAWAYPEGTGRYSARHLTLGVELASLAMTPSVQTAVDAYLHEVASIPGATPVPNPKGSIFDPAQAPAVKDEIIRALTRLHESTQPAADPSDMETS